MRKQEPAGQGVLVVDDEPTVLAGARVALRAAGLERVVTCQDSRKVPEILKDGEIGVVVLDLHMPHLRGIDLLALIQQEFPHVAVIVMTGDSDIDTAVECMKSGAFDYLVKPVEGSRLVAGVRKALEIAALRGEVSLLRHRLLSGKIENEEAFAAIRTGSEKMLALFRYVEAVAPSPQSIMICGETGVGKELVARAIHTLSGRAGEFVAVNVAGLDDTLFTDTLCGHRKGAFTGAEAGREGLIAKAASGTLFMDEVGDLTPPSQVRLLRLLQEKIYYPLGSDVPVRADARILVATHQNPQELIEEGKFRKDLYYRLSTHLVTIPPLRERVEDLPLLLDQFLEEAAHFLGMNKPTPPAELSTLLSTYSFPGNVRELQNMVFDAVAQHRSGILSMESFRKAIGEGPLLPSPEGGTEGAAAKLALAPSGRLPTLKKAEQFLIAEAMRRAEGNQGIAAGLLGISRQALNKRLIRAGKKK